MNEPSSALRTAAVERAARAIEADKLQVIDRDWQSGEHRLDLAATPGADIFTVVEVRLVPGVPVIGASCLGEATRWLCGGSAPEVTVPCPAERSGAGDMSDIRGNRTARLAAEVSAAGGPHLSLSGPPGSGMALLASRMRGLLPPLDGRARPTRGDCAAALGLRMGEIR